MFALLLVFAVARAATWQRRTVARSWTVWCRAWRSTCLTCETLRDASTKPVCCAMRPTACGCSTVSQSPKTKDFWIIMYYLLIYMIQKCSFPTHSKYQHIYIFRINFSAVYKKINFQIAINKKNQLIQMNLNNIVIFHIPIEPFCVGVYNLKTSSIPLKINGIDDFFSL